MNYINAIEWKPEEIVLEQRALQVVTTDENILVAAGPGAGKTELLAQKASYLLETNTCSYPRRILAISFKREAKSNLEERVEKRCGKELSKRFDSMTFDGFAKRLVDQFRTAIPKEYRPTSNYNIGNQELLQSVFLRHYPGARNYKKNKSINLMYKSLEHRTNLLEIDNQLEKFWMDLLHENGTGESELTFSMISILAKYLIESNPLILKILNATYSHVFLDEFQDTTSIQYELTKECFGRSQVALTAVGDNKQRIMVWAGAKVDIFDTYKREFNAQEMELLMNYRSSPKLIQLQTLLYPLLKMEIDEIRPSNKWEQEEGEANLHYFEDCERESTVIANEIHQLISKGKDHRDIVILIKHSLPRYTGKIQEKLYENGIRARDEGVYQELLVEEIVMFVLSSFYISQNRDADSWLFLTNFVFTINDSFDEDDINEDLYSLINDISLTCQGKLANLTVANSSEDLFDLIKSLIAKVGYDKIVATYEQYNQEEYFWNMLSETAKLIWEEYLRCEDWINALEGFEGENTIPMMTIHKSKGLEYDVVFFVGVEDGAFFSYDRQSHEDNCAFFVALSRAKKRVDFTFSFKRESARYNPNQRYNEINVLHELLKESDIVTVIEHDS